MDYSHSNASSNNLRFRRVENPYSWPTPHTARSHSISEQSSTSHNSSTASRTSPDTSAPSASTSMTERALPPIPRSPSAPQLFFPADLTTSEPASTTTSPSTSHPMSKPQKLSAEVTARMKSKLKDFFRRDLDVYRNNLKVSGAGNHWTDSPTDE